MQKRFYDIMEHYQDDYRIAAHAITYFLQEETKVEDIYRDLLGAKIRKWTPKLEHIIRDQEDITIWADEMIFRLDMMNSNIWSIGDTLAIERGAWKYGIGLEEDNDI